MIGAALSYEVRDGVAVVTVDVPGSRVNAISSSLLEAMDRLVTAIEADSSVHAVVLRSGKESGFIAGADLHEIAGIRSREVATAISRRAHAILDRIAAGRKPWVAAIHGAALGGGLEIALACRWIVVTEDPATVLALPEIQLGLIPGAGGTQRLPRRIGIDRALPLLLTGTRLRPRKALEWGLADEVVAPERLLDAALSRAQALTRGRRHHAPWRVRLANFFLMPMAIGKARAEVVRKSGYRLPAPHRLLDVVEEGFKRSMKRGCESETATFGALVVTRESRHLVRLFERTNERRKAPGGGREVKRIGVVGAGLMGRGIASISLDLAEVVLEDMREEALEAAKKEIAGGFRKRVASGALRDADAGVRSARLLTAASLERLAGCDLVIEAVFEDLSLKRQLFAEIEKHVGPQAVLASNTSALPISTIAAGLQYPERVVGMHYFSPVPKMPLLELVVPPGASPGAVETARAFGIAQGKTVIAVGDGPGFYTTRILAPLLNEAMMLLAEGAEVPEIEKAMKKFGFPVGPITLLDEVGIDVAAHVSSALGAAFADRGHRPSVALDRMAAKGWLGRKSGMGFFLYEDGKKGMLNPEAAALVRGSALRAVAPEEIVDRCVMAMVNEAARCLDEGILRSTEDGDLGAVLGLGFPPEKGGPFSWVEDEGFHAMRELLELLEIEQGPRFKPAHWWRTAGVPVGPHLG